MGFLWLASVAFGFLWFSWQDASFSSLAEQLLGFGSISERRERHRDGLAHRELREFDSQRVSMVVGKQLFLFLLVMVLWEIPT